MVEQPTIDSNWVIAMIVFGSIGVMVHLLIISTTFPVLVSSELKGKGKLLIVACILAFAFNGIACLIWVLFRTDILISLSINSCKFIYIANFLCYFIAKYISHCILIGRIYVVFYGTAYQIKFKAVLLFVAILSVHFLATIGIWTIEVFPNILTGVWTEHGSIKYICTLFSENAQNTINVKICAVLVGVEDFIVGGITLYIILKRFFKIYKSTDDSFLIDKSVRYGVLASISMISTLFIFTLAVPLYPNVTFIIAIDATINSLCIFCVLSIGSKVYNILCFACVFCEKKYMSNDDAGTLSMIIHSEPANTEEKTDINTTTDAMKTESQFSLISKSNERKISLQCCKSEPANDAMKNLKKSLNNQHYAVSI